MNRKPGQSGGALASGTPWEVICLLVLWTLAGQLSPTTPDTIRDIFQAYSIATGEAFPLTGPQLAGTVHLGPLWFYILALPALVSDSWGSMALLAFLLSALKFWLAFDLGKKLHSARLGLLLALFLALPSWTSIQMVIWTHTIVLETALLLFLLALRRSYRSPTASNWFLTGLCFSLALHAHPTALPYFLLVLLVWRQLIDRWFWPVMLGLGAAVLFLPYGIEQLLTGFPALGALQDYYTHQFSPGGPVAALKLLYSVVVIGPNLFYQTTLPAPFAVIAIALHWLLIAVTLGLCLRNLRTAEPQLKRLWAGSLLMVLVVTVVVMVMRAQTIWHMAYAPSFALAFFYAVSATIASQGDFPFRSRVGFSAIIILLFASSVAGAGYRIYHGTIRFQSDVLAEVKTLRSEWSTTGLELPAHTAGDHGDYLCGQTPVVLHGGYAAVIDAHAGIEALMECGQKDEILIGGQTDAAGYSHVVGISLEMAEVLGTSPDRTVGNVLLYRPLAVAAAGTPVPLADGTRYPLRKPFSGGSTEQRELQLESATGSALLVSSPVGYYFSLELQEVSCNRGPARLAVRTNYSWLYTCDDDGAGPMNWHVRYNASAPHLIDAVLLAHE
jgi:hypothetical protein